MVTGIQTQIFICFRREKQLPGYKPSRRLGSTLRKIQNYRRRLNPPINIPGNAQKQQQQQQSSSPDPETTPEVNNVITS